MVEHAYDIITVGGGLACSTLARAMAERGAQVLVVERETHFKDRIRGEGIAPWGVAELQTLGVYDLLLETGAQPVPFWDSYRNATLARRRDTVATTPQELPWLSFSHPVMQEILLQAAIEAGAHVWRGVRVGHVQPGKPPTVQVTHAGKTTTLTSRLVVAGDGRRSLVRQWAGGTIHQDLPLMLMAGVLLEGLDVDQSAMHVAINVNVGSIGLLVPQPNHCVRAYVGYQHDAYPRFQGARDLTAFTAACSQTGLPATWFSEVQAAGPLATFDAATTWISPAYKDGVAFIGDAAASTDPSWGQGMSLTVRDARVLRDQLCACADWDAAGRAYAEEHNRYMKAVWTMGTWFTELFMERGSEADARRARALPLLAQDGTRMPDVFHSGPEVPVGEKERYRLFGEDDLSV